jgi:chromosome segregation ATPase
MQTREELEDLIERTEEARLRVSGDRRYLTGAQMQLNAKREQLTWQIEANIRQMDKLRGEEETLIGQIKLYKTMLQGAPDGT